MRYDKIMTIKAPLICTHNYSSFTYALMCSARCTYS